MGALRRPGRGPARRGASVAEVLVALLVGLLVVHAAISTAGRVRSAQRRIQDRTDGLLSGRLLSGVLRTELRFGRPGVDWALVDGAIELRAFRGTGLVCPAAASADELMVAYEGHRRPDPAKDSVLAVQATGATEVLALVGLGAAPDTCAGSPLPGGLMLRLERPPTGAPVLARVFERGSYSVADGALRYRRGAAGRQPLTPEVWAGASRLSLDGGWLRAELRPRGEPEGTAPEIRSLARGGAP